MPRPFLTCRAILLVALIVTLAARAAAESPSGEQIFKELCAKCHGAAGEGNAERDTGPLSGDRSLAELAEIIDKSMPEDAPEKCNGEEAKAVATYIYGAFYSPIAQARIQPARVELSRLTVRQYQNAIADLIGSFRDGGSWGSERGLKGEYYKGRRTRRSERVLERIDPTVDFDWADSSPDPEKFEPHEFSIEWEGSVLAPETGDYEFIIRTDHAARLWINDLETPLIDAWVKSGDDTEYRGAIRLLGGRAYSVKLDFSKAKQGVNDRDKEKEKPPPKKASIALLWKLPHRTLEVIPARCLSPERQPELSVVHAAFPPDDRSVGYERGTAISKAWDEATTEGAIETAGYVEEHLRELSGAGEDDSDRAAKLREFCYRFVERAFRRPLSDEQKQVFVDRQFEQAPQPEMAVKRVVLLALKSPRFLYREVGRDQPDAYDVASRVSFGLWDSLPDQPLLDAAAAGQLTTREQVAGHVDRMLPDLRTRSKLRQFFQQWLKVEQVPDLAKDPERYASFNAEVANDLRTALDLFVEEVVWSDASDFRQLLLADSLPLNGRLARFYGADVPEDAPFEKRSLDGEHRAGLLTHPYLLTTFAYTGTSSPIHRGVFISRSLLGRVLKPPPEAVVPLPPESHANLTTRERIALQTNSQACLSCHAMINPLGFTLEHFDAVGRFRAEETGKPIDATGEYLTKSGERKQFRGVRELAKFLSESDETHAAFVQQLFHHTVKQPIRAYGPEMSVELQKSFRENQFSIQELTVEIVVRSALGQPPPANDQ
jgi:hypothetical protein